MSVLHAPTYRWTVHEYESLGRAGFLEASDRVELLNGEIVLMSPIGYRHAIAVRRLTAFFVRASAGRFDVNPQNPFHLDEHSEPQPDLALVDTASDQAGRHPRPSEIYLLIEVADTSVQYDRQEKGPAYASQGILEFWLLNLETKQLEVYRRPERGRYTDVLEVGPPHSAAPLRFPDIIVRVADFIP